MSQQGEPGYYEQEIYRAAAVKAVADSGPAMYTMPIGEVCHLAADGAIAADRKRMAEMLRYRTMWHADESKLPPRLSMMVDELMFKLAEQIEMGLPHQGQSDNSPEPPA